MHLSILLELISVILAIFVVILYNYKQIRNYRKILKAQLYRICLEMLLAALPTLTKGS